MHVSASFTDHRDAARSMRVLSDYGIAAAIAPLANVDPPLADPVRVTAEAARPDEARIAADAFVELGGAILVDDAGDPATFDSLDPTGG